MATASPTCTGNKVTNSCHCESRNILEIGRVCSTITNGPTLMCIMDTEDNIFGALISSPIVISKTFYGTGECFLFKAKPEFEVYNWSQENSNFVR